MSTSLTNNSLNLGEAVTIEPSVGFVSDSAGSTLETWVAPNFATRVIQNYVPYQGSLTLPVGFTAVLYRGPSNTNITIPSGKINWASTEDSGGQTVGTNFSGLGVITRIS